jgi:hypothetical protein
LSPDEEKQRYSTHQNDVLDDGYRRHFAKLLGPLCAKLPANAEGLDYGSGPFPSLQTIMQEKNYSVSLYDLYFQPDQKVFAKKYDFVTCVEVAEHFFDPHQEFNRMVSLLKPGGILAVMTQFYPATAQEFARWYYHRDPTHVCFYNRTTFGYLAEHCQLHLEIPADNIALLTRA